MTQDPAPAPVPEPSGRRRPGSHGAEQRTDAQTAVNGVAAGARVVVDGAGFLNEGDRVTVSTGAARPAAQPAPQPAAQPAAK